MPKSLYKLDNTLRVVTPARVTQQEDSDDLSDSAEPQAEKHFDYFGDKVVVSVAINQYSYPSSSLLLVCPFDSAKRCTHTGEGLLKEAFQEWLSEEDAVQALRRVHRFYPQPFPRPLKPVDEIARTAADWLRQSLRKEFMSRMGIVNFTEFLHTFQRYDWESAFSSIYNKIRQDPATVVFTRLEKANAPIPR